MPDEPNHPIEGDLKAYARQRRVELGRPQQMPAVTRELLLREAGVPDPQRAAQTAESASEDRPARLPKGDPAVFVWWPRLLMTGLGFAVVAIGVAVLMPQLAKWSGRGVQELARNEDRATETELQLREKILQKSGQMSGARVAQVPPALADTLDETRLERARQAEADEMRLPLAKSKTETFDRSVDRLGGVAENKARLDLATSQPAPPAAPAPMRVQTLADADGRSYGVALKDAPAEAKRDRAEAAQTLPAPATAAAGLAEASKEQSALNYRANVPAANATTLAPASAAVSGPIPASKNYQRNLTANQLNVANGRQFAQNTLPLRRNPNSPPPAPVMNNFNFEQIGDTVRIVDEDGSIYLGRVENTVTSLSAEAKKEGESLSRTAQAAAQNAQNAPAQFTFRADGINQSLNQTVRIDGNYVTVTPAQNAPGGAPAAPGGQAVGSTLGVALANNSPPGVAQNVQIKGRVIIGQTNQVILNALPVLK